MRRNFATIKPLTTRGRPAAAETFQRLAQLLAGAKARGEVQFKLVDGDIEESYSVPLGGKRTASSKRASKRPALEVFLKSETWSEIAEGKLSPLEAIVSGRMRVRGDVELGLRLMRHLRGSEGEVEICR